MAGIQMFIQSAFLSARSIAAAKSVSSNRLTQIRPIIIGLVAGALVFAVDYAGTAVVPQLHSMIDFAIMVTIVPLILTLGTREILRVRAQAVAEQVSAIQEERRDFSRDLHDSIAQHLAYLHLKLDQLAHNQALVSDPAVRDELEKMREVTDEAYEEVYFLLSTLRSVPADGLYEALKARLTWAGRRAGFHAHFTSLGQARPLTPFAAQQIAYIVREALTNVEKHAEACNVWVAVEWGDSDLALSVSDDGRGFDPASVAPSGHFGLHIMRERAEQIGGTLKIQSSVGSGSQVLFSAPVARVIAHPVPARRRGVPALFRTQSSSHDR
jgi:signal transduction histidine kinase